MAESMIEDLRKSFNELRFYYKLTRYLSRPMPPEQLSFMYEKLYTVKTDLEPPLKECLNETKGLKRLNPGGNTNEAIRHFIKQTSRVEALVNEIGVFLDEIVADIVE